MKISTPATCFLKKSPYLCRTIQHNENCSEPPARVAQLVERDLAKVEVASSNLVSRSIVRKKALLHGNVFFNTGAGDEVRTRDLDLGKVALYQLSYSRGRFIATFVALNGDTKVTGQLSLPRAEAKKTAAGTFPLHFQAQNLDCGFSGFSGLVGFCSRLGDWRG